jgi:hypothetical protein
MAILSNVYILILVFQPPGIFAGSATAYEEQVQEETRKAVIPA